ncbi:hypothetical protein ACHAXR_003254 [Thalassiosira sp. AJA248-18]
MRGNSVLLLAAFALSLPFVYVLTNETKYLGQHSSTADSLQLNLDQPSTPATVSKTKGKKWPLWHEMNPSEQEEKLEQAYARAAPYGKMLGSKPAFHNLCSDGNEPLKFGDGDGHMVCGPPPNTTEECKFFSFGIRDDPSWDKHLGEAWNCRGFAGDPSIVHPSKLHPAVTFHNIGLKMLRSNAEQRKDPKDEWILVSMPQLRKFLGWNYIDIIKLDCEGCEVAMARDILAEDPTFLDNVGQISIETHGTRTWVNTTEELYYYALMFPLLEDAGFKLIWNAIFGCGKWEHGGCHPDMMGKMNMSCGNRPRNKVNRVPIGWSCHDWLWAKV